MAKTPAAPPANWHNRSAGGAGSAHGTGGMASKIRCAQMVFARNSQMVLMNSREPRDILRVLDGEDIGTWFVQEA